MRVPRRLSDNAWSLIAAATRLAHERSTTLAPEHLLLAMMLSQYSVAVTLLKNLGVDIRRAREVLERELNRNSSTSDESAERRWTQLIATADLEGAPVCSEHLLVALAAESGGLASSVLQVHGATLDGVRHELWILFGGGHGVDQRALRAVVAAPAQQPILSRFRPQLQHLMAELWDALTTAQYERAIALQKAAVTVRQELIAAAGHC